MGGVRTYLVAMSWGDVKRLQEEIVALKEQNVALKKLAFRALREIVNPICCPPEFCEYTEYANSLVIDAARKLGVEVPVKEPELEAIETSMDRRDQ